VGQVQRKGSDKSELELEWNWDRFIELTFIGVEFGMLCFLFFCRFFVHEIEKIDVNLKMIK